jgi:hypothetical protein
MIEHIVKLETPAPWWQDLVIRSLPILAWVILVVVACAVAWAIRVHVRRLRSIEEEVRHLRDEIQHLRVYLESRDKSTKT